MSKRILLLFHGKKHSLRDNSIIAKLGELPCTIEGIAGITTIDDDPDAAPTLVANLTEPLTDDQLQVLGKFDVITSEYPPLPIYDNTHFFENVTKLLNSGGVFALSPILLTESKYPWNAYKWTIPKSAYKEMKARTKMGKEIVERHPDFACFMKKNKLLVFIRAYVPPC
jgi:hypothetical protein